MEAYITFREDSGDAVCVSLHFFFILNQDPAEFSRESLLFPRGGWATLGAYIISILNLDGFEGPKSCFVFTTEEVL